MNLLCGAKPVIRVPLRLDLGEAVVVLAERGPDAGVVGLIGRRCATSYGDSESIREPVTTDQGELRHRLNSRLCTGCSLPTVLNEKADSNQHNTDDSTESQLEYRNDFAGQDFRE